MTQEELSQQVSQSQQQIQTLRAELDTIKKSLIEHQHSGLDGSAKLSNESVWLKEGRALGAGQCGIAGTKRNIQGTDFYYGVMAVGSEVGYGQQTFGNKTTNAEIVFQHQLGGLSFLYPFVDPVDVLCSDRNISVVSGQTVFSDSVLDLGADNSKAGYYLILRRKAVDPSDYTDYGYQIASNTKSSVTLSSGITFSGVLDEYIIATFLYLGCSVAQFKKIYTLDGLRFGAGESYNGQNGLLYMDSSGVLQYKNPSGTISGVGGHSYIVKLLQFADTATTANTTVPAGALITGWWVPQNGWYNSPALSWVSLYISGTTLYAELLTAPGTGKNIAINVGILY